ncbi:MAG TPA: hypothetical protein VHZ95_03460 [Polyangiales bacterium]|jgi:urease accessory protein|nr:hypothetical protein [Polyangiales bacterium]
MSVRRDVPRFEHKSAGAGADRSSSTQLRAARVGIGGSAGSGKTRLLEQLLPRLCTRGVEFAILDDPPLTAAGEDPASEPLFTGLELMLIESEGGAQPAFDHRLFVVDISAAAKLSAARDPRLLSADLVVINKLDLASYTPVDLPRLLAELEALRIDRPTLLTSCETGQGLDAVLEHLIGSLLVRAGDDAPNIGE